MSMQSSINSVISSTQQGLAINKYLENQDKNFRLQAAESDLASATAFINEQEAADQGKITNEMLKLQRNINEGTQARDNKTGKFLTRENSIEKYEKAMSELRLQRQAIMYAREQAVAQLKGEQELIKKGIVDPRGKLEAREMKRQEKAFEKSLKKENK